MRYNGEAESTGGRRAAGVEIVPDARIAIGVSVTGHHLRFLAADLRLHEIAYRSVLLYCLRHGAHGGGGDHRPELESFIDGQEIDRSRLLGVCIAVPGVLTADHRRVMFAPTLHQTDADLSALYERIPYPSYVENDATSSGHAEWFVRGARGNLAYLSLEGGVGGSALIGSAPYHGSNGRSCEFGHMCLVPGGLPCSCGKRGCLERTARPTG